VDVSGYTVDQVWYPSKDGTPVSMFLIRRKDLQRDGNNPVMLTGYGGFNVSMEPFFSTVYTVWLEAGGMVALPNLRGGGEYGKTWHEAGLGGKKQNVFDDFLAAAQWLIANKYTTPGRLAIEGGSNGGLLVGAALVQRPELFRAVSCTVPLLDMVRYHKFGMANEWAEEYGSSEDAEAFKYLYAYSPYHHVKDKTAYPAVLLVGSEDDARVDPLHARKMAARLQEADPNGRPILLIVQRASGHGGGTTLTTLIGQYADEFAFLMNELGMRGRQK
jgi:prolyl oligopeptidase